MSNASSQPALCSEPLLFSFNDLGSRQVIADFSAGYLSSDGGMLLLRQIDEGLGISRSLARCFYDARNPLFIEHSVRELVAQRLLGMAAGYQDLNDHNLLRLDPLFAVAVGKEDPLGSGRAPQDQGKALASASTLNRLELGNNKNSRCHKISADHEAIEDDLLRMGVRCLPKHSLEVVIDLDTTDDPLHGHQEGRFFHGFYGCYCYLPLFAFVGSVPLWAQLRTSEGDAARGAVDALKKLVAAVRKRCPKARIIVCADSGFCREEIMAWCETQQPVVYYCLGLARNSRLRELIDEKFGAPNIRRSAWVWLPSARRGARVRMHILSAHENVNAVDLKKAEPIYALAKLRRADGLVATHRVEALRRKRDATSFGSGEFRLQCCSPATVEMNARRSASIRSGCSKAAKCPPDGISLQ
jgi:Transposase DDE domain group 1